MKLNKGVNSVNIKYGTTSAQECVYKSVRRRMPCPKTPFSSCPEEFYVSFCLLSELRKLLASGRHSVLSCQHVSETANRTRDFR